MKYNHYQDLISIIYGKGYVLNKDLKTITYTKEDITLLFDINSIELKEEMLSWIKINNFECKILNQVVIITSDKYFEFKKIEFKKKGLIDNIIQSIIFINQELLRYVKERINNLKTISNILFSNVKIEEKEKDIKIYKKEEEFNFNPYIDLEQFHKYILTNPKMSKYILTKKNEIYELNFKGKLYKSNNFQEVVIKAFLKGGR
jgi:hypothetical protein